MRTFEFKLQPTKPQERCLIHYLDACRSTYNWALKTAVISTATLKSLLASSTSPGTSSISKQIGHKLCLRSMSMLSRPRSNVLT